MPELWVGQASNLQHTVVIPPGGVTGNQSKGEYEALVARLQVRGRDEGELISRLALIKRNHSVFSHSHYPLTLLLFPSVTFLYSCRLK